MVYLLADGVDFRGATETFEFSRFTSNVPQCVCIPVLQDSIVEGTESFGIRLDTSDVRVQLTQNSTVLIADDGDGMW